MSHLLLLECFSCTVFGTYFVQKRHLSRFDTINGSPLSNSAHPSLLELFRHRLVDQVIVKPLPTILSELFVQVPCAYVQVTGL